ncbi:hypothetical protein [Tuwongella immobilis]|uniref:Uncharacterized protein n=1 Tax=Tuwongella immobilis TaxID=692036 RepID=A0A6C2YKZ2_9BACT|nr:hypothetical protein [Tuwongella immobilis]VIP02044.1 unnamed protein product [Tuwongella immobilis]VTS00219.1 unnamed protein product [Tuwongella immobilis]
MGAESFLVAMKTDSSMDTILTHLKKQAIPLFEGSQPNSFLLSDGKHVIEILVNESTSIVMFIRFALCNPTSIDEIFKRFILEMSQNCQMSIQICEDYGSDSETSHEFPLTDICFEVITQAILFRRQEWRTEFGPVEIGISTGEALYRFANQQTTGLIADQ